MLKHYLTIIFRTLMQQKIRSVLSVLCITAGLICFSLCSYYYYVFTNADKTLSTYDRLVVVRSQSSIRFYIGLPNEKLKKIEEIAGDAIEAKNLESSFKGIYVTSSNDRYSVTGSITTSDYFKLYPTRLVEGRWEDFNEEFNQAVVTTEFMKKFADKDVKIGSTIKLSDIDYQIVVIVEPYEVGVNRNLVPAQVFLTAPWVRERLAKNGFYFLMKPGVDLKVINERLRAVKWGDSPDLTPCFYWKSEDQLTNEMPLYLAVLGLLILLIALINYFSFSVGAFVNRMNTIRLRQSLGGKAFHLWGWLCGEQCVIIFVSLMFTLALTDSLFPVVMGCFSSFVQGGLYVDLGTLLGMQLQIGGYLFLLPIVISAVTVHRVMKYLHGSGLSGRQSRGNLVLRNVLQTFQLFITLGFISGIIAISAAMDHSFEEKFPSLIEEDQENIIPFSISARSEEMQQHRAEIIRALKQGAWCESVSEYAYGHIIDMKPGEATTLLVDETFLDQVHVEHKHHQGEIFAYVTKEFDESFRVRRDSAFQKVCYEGVNYPIVGQHQHYVSYNDHLVLLPLPLTIKYTNGYIKLKDGCNRAEALKEINAILNKYYPVNEPYVVESLFDKEMIGYILMKNLFIVCAVLAILITLLGLYQSISLDTERRQKEVAIRKINGAKKMVIYRLFGRRYLVLLTIAFVLSLPVTGFILVLSKYSYAFNVTTASIFTLPLLITILVVGLTIGWKIWKIAQINPAKVIKSE